MDASTLTVAFVGINAKYTHTALGIRSIFSYTLKYGDEYILPNLSEFTINDRTPQILERLYALQADVYLFSCYIWNIDHIRQITQDLRQICPNCFIALGGPEVGYQSEKAIERFPQVDAIFSGEGENATIELLNLLKDHQPIHTCPGLSVRHKSSIITTAPSPSISLDEIPFAYPDLAQLKHKTIYYESARGCPFTCSYCTSSIAPGVRTRSLSLVFADLSQFLAHNVQQVKFVDRTFNCNKIRARNIWEWICKNDNGFTNFHFELAGDLLDDNTLSFLKTVRPGLFQFEIGVQTTHEPTLREIDRSIDTSFLFKQVSTLRKFENIHLHLDLIAGLPHETFNQFAVSFNTVYAQRPHQLQLGILKVLSGSKMERKAQQYQLISSLAPPYSVLSTAWLTYSEMTRLQGIADVVDIYYNSNRFSTIIPHLISYFPSAFDFFAQLHQSYLTATSNGPISKLGYYDVLLQLMHSNDIPLTEKMKWRIKYDLLLHEKPRKLPGWIDVDMSKAYRKSIRDFFADITNIQIYLPQYQKESPVRIERLAHLEIFPAHPLTDEEGPIMALFNYDSRDILGKSTVHFIPLPFSDLE